MKKWLRTLAALSVLAAGCTVSRPSLSQEKGPAKDGPVIRAEGGTRAAEAMKGLREKLLKSPPEQIGLTGEDAKAKVWGVLMDVSMPSGSATLVSLRDGTSSLYTETGGGVLGGYAAREEAKAFVAEAEKSLKQMSPAGSFDYPEVGRVKFYVLTRDGVLSAEARPEELLKGRHDLSPLFRAANDVLTRLRLSTEKKE